MRRTLLATISMLAVAACGGSAQSPASSPAADVGSGSLTGAGSTFTEPFYTKAFYLYNQAHSSVTVNYQPVGSGAGIQQLTKGTVDFGASDVPMNATELDAAGGPSSVVQIPTTLGVVSMAYNLPDVPKLQLDGPTIADIYLGKVKTWNDPEIKSLNAGVNLPGKPIAVVHRSDGSGTSYAFTDYLSKVSPEWKSKVGVGKSVAWPAGTGGNGNQGVAQAVKQADGGLGYVELAYVIQTQMQQAYLKNKNGKFVQASQDGASQAAAQSTGLSPANYSITDAPGDASYPIATFTWAILRTDQTDAAKGKALVNLFNWLISPAGQAPGKDLQYAPLPAPVAALGVGYLKTIKTGGKPILP